MAINAYDEVQADTKRMHHAMTCRAHDVEATSVSKSGLMLHIFVKEFVPLETQSLPFWQRTKNLLDFMEGNLQPRGRKS